MTHKTNFSLVFCTLVCGFSLLLSDVVVAQQVANATESTRKQADTRVSSGQDKKQNAAETIAPFRTAEMDHFLRIRKSAKRKPVAFETSITRYIGQNEEGDSIYVDLIGVVHVGEGPYYRRLNEIFEDYDAVLYELVAPEGAIPDPAEREGFNPIAALQVGMQTVTGLQFQLDHIDYRKSNFVHADMSPTEFAQSMENNEESITKIMAKAISQSFTQSANSQLSNFDLIRVALAKDKEIKLRQLFARQMIDMEAGMKMFEGRDGSTIIDHRNGKAMKVLKREIGKRKKKLAVFYGAGHLPDMEQRLLRDFDMKRAGQYWLEAWKLAR